MLQTIKKDTFWERLYPTTKLWLEFAIIILVFTATNYWLSALIFLFFLILITYYKMLRAFKYALLAMFILGISLFSIQGLFNPSNVTPLFTLIPNTSIIYYQEGVIKAADLYCRILPIVACMFLIIRSTNMTDLGIALNKAGVSYKFNYILISTFQIIPVFQKDMNQIMNAQKARGLETEGSLRQRFTSFIPIIVPLIANSIVKVQSKAMALETKGFNSTNKKTYYRDLDKTRNDHIVIIISILIACSGLTYWILSLLHII